MAFSRHEIMPRISAKIFGTLCVSTLTYSEYGMCFHCTPSLACERAPSPLPQRGGCVPNGGTPGTVSLLLLSHPPVLAPCHIYQCTSMGGHHRHTLEGRRCVCVCVHVEVTAHLCHEPPPQNGRHQCQKERHSCSTTAEGEAQNIEENHLI